MRSCVLGLLLLRQVNPVLIALLACGPYAIQQYNGKNLTVRAQDIPANCLASGNLAKAQKVGWEG
jgi:hypothetical protein